ncbi:uncharacterized protein LOC134818907 [Bolinopsis microptera]|uniref:uncharacterized protein LOC134818907 n=1 Tax=Bolinopsis microptera TaxID=2820187 RepID=UPI00307A5CE4
MGGNLFFNRLSYSTDSRFIFGGQIYQFNIFSDVLSSVEVKKIAEGGLCMDLNEFSGTRALRWEHILSQSRSGSVSEFMMCEWKNKLEARLRAAEEKLTNVTGQLSRTEEKLNTTLEELGAVRGELERTERELQTESAQHNKTGEQLDTCSTSLTSALTQLEGDRTFHNLTRWEVLYTSPYFNKVLPEELFQKLSSSWGMLGKFACANISITEGVVDHFLLYHQEPVCDVFEQISYPMLRQFERVEWTKNITDHL